MIASWSTTSVPGITGRKRPPLPSPYATPVVFRGRAKMSFLSGFVPAMIHDVKSADLVSQGSVPAK